MSAQLAQTLLNSGNAEYIANLYREFLKNPSAVDSSWRNFFTDMRDDESALLKELIGATWTPNHQKRPQAPFGFVPPEDMPKSAKPANQSKAGAPAAGVDPQALKDSIQAVLLVRAYRDFGHLMANLDPLGFKVPQMQPQLDPATYGFSDMNRKVQLGGIMGYQETTIGNLVQALQNTYCNRIGVEYTFIYDSAEREWVQSKVESSQNRGTFSADDKKRIFTHLVAAEGLEQFLHAKFTGAKRFGVDGGEAYVAALEEGIRRAAELGVEEVVVGMAHRGRLNTLTNVLGKSYTALFSEFQGTPSIPEGTPGSGDVKYHLGYSNDKDYGGHKVHLTLTPNPSHLEAVNPVAMGKVRAKQDMRGDTERSKVMAVLVHGDAAFAGQGVVAESLAMANLKGYSIGGTFHIIINNQIGFTTRPDCARSGPYSSDMAKMLACPIFHVNGDDAEAVAHVARTAAEYRAMFKKDVVIDLICYRRYGHNEGDEPAFTQPIMYKKIKSMETVRNVYAKQLAAEGIQTAEASAAIIDAFNKKMDESFEATKGYKVNKVDAFEGDWSSFGFAPKDAESWISKTALTKDKMKEYGEKLTAIPEGFNLNSKIARQFEQKKEMFKSGQGFDWATGESLAFASLVDEGHPVRLSGEDVGRGTFSHRHAKLWDQENDSVCSPLQKICDKQGRFEAYESHLSEMAVLGYEYGYTWADPKALVLWEAQFGDFVNGAQIIIDQYISSAESKWLRQSGLVMLLPHGSEGQGPEHSSARPERFLQSCAEDNWQITNITTPANYFHALRRQVKRDFRKPMVNMSPKSLLRHKLAVSPAEAFVGDTTFQPVLLDDASASLVKGKDVKRVILCSGKVYYDLFEEREKRGIKNIVLLRVEQLYPFPAKKLTQELAQYPNADFVWCQEEPKNQGYWFFVDPLLEDVLRGVGTKSNRAKFVGRPAAAAPATGYLKRHAVEQAALIDEALKI